MACTEGDQCGGLCLLPLGSDVSGQILYLGLYLGGVFPFSQVGSTNSMVPSTPARGSSEFWSSLSPVGLSDVVKQLCDALRPHLHRGWVGIPGGEPWEGSGEGSGAQGDVPVCCRPRALRGVGSVLLSGPGGSGKLMAVRAVCSCLNLHLFKVIPPVGSGLLGLQHTENYGNVF